MRKISPTQMVALILFAFVLIGTAAITLLFRNLIEQQIAVPLLFLFWLVDLLVKSIDQEIIWGLFSLIAFFIIFFSLLRRNRVMNHDLYSETEHTGKGRVNFWLAYLNLLKLGSYSREYFFMEIKRLLVSVLAFKERSTGKEIEKRIEAGEIFLTDPVRKFFDHPSRSRHTNSYNFLQGLWNLLLNWRFLHLLSKPKESDESELNQAIAFIEDQLEEK